MNFINTRPGLWLSRDAFLLVQVVAQQKEILECFSNWNSKVMLYKVRHKNALHRMLYQHSVYERLGSTPNKNKSTV